MRSHLDMAREHRYGLTKVWVHALWGTKNCQPLLRETIRPQIAQHLYDAFQEQECQVRIVDGLEDHMHALFLLTPGISLAGVMRLVLAESSDWINRQRLLKGPFSWQSGYGGFSVSGSMVGKVENYIRTQETHHRRMTFEQEYERLYEKYKKVCVV